MNINELFFNKQCLKQFTDFTEVRSFGSNSRRARRFCRKFPFLLFPMQLLQLLPMNVRRKLDGGYCGELRGAAASGQVRARPRLGIERSVC